MDRIAYVGTDGNIFTINPDGSDSRRLTGNITAGAQGIIQASLLQEGFIFYTWPTWSPDGKKLAVSQIILEGDVPTVSLFTLGTSEGGNLGTGSKDENRGRVAEPVALCHTSADNPGLSAR